jgi:invasion protein IalB
MRRSARSICAIFLLTSSAAFAADETPQPPIQLTYTPWVKFCLKGQDADARRICFTSNEGRSASRQQPDVSAAVIEPAGDPKKIFRVTVPLDMLLAQGTRVIIDNMPPQQNSYVTCSALGCLSDYEATTELIDNLRKGRRLVVQAINTKGAPLTWVVPLDTFRAAYDGPATDPATWEEQQKKALKPVLDDTLAPRYRPNLQ